DAKGTPHRGTGTTAAFCRLSGADAPRPRHGHGTAPRLDPDAFRYAPLVELGPACADDTGPVLVRQRLLPRRRGGAPTARERYEFPDRGRPARRLYLFGGRHYCARLLCRSRPEHGRLL